MTKKSIFSIIMLCVLSAVGFALASCGSDNDEPEKTLTQEYVVRGEITSQGGHWINGEGGLNGSNSPEFRFYKSVYDRVSALIAPQVWEVKFTANEKDAKLKEQNAVAETRFSEVLQGLKAIKQELEQMDKNTYKCHFDMTIKLVARGDKEIRSGEITLKYEGNEE